MNAIIQPVAI